MHIELWTRAETAKYLRVSLSTFERHVAPTLDGYKLGAKWLYKRADVDAWIERQRVTRAPMPDGRLHNGPELGARPTLSLGGLSREARAIDDALERRRQRRLERERAAKGQ